MHAAGDRRVGLLKRRRRPAAKDADGTEATDCSPNAVEGFHDARSPTRRHVE